MFEEGLRDGDGPGAQSGSVAEWGLPGAQESVSAAVAWLEDVDVVAAGRSQTLSCVEVSQRLIAWASAMLERSLARAEQITVELDAAAAAEAKARAAAKAQTDRASSGQAGVDGDRVWGGGKGFFAEEVGVVMRVDGGYARARMTYAAELVGRLPLTFAQLQAGRLTPLKAQLMGATVLSLPDEDAAAIEAAVLARAETQTMTQYQRSLRRALNRVCPKTAERARADARAERRVRIRAGEDGMSSLYAVLPTDAAIRVETALNHFADTHRAVQAAQADQSAQADQAAQAEWASMDTLRADGLVAFANRYLDDPESFLSEADRAFAPKPGRIKIKPQVQVTVALSTLIGVDDQPGELAGHGPIPASLARQLAADQDSTWRRLVTDSCGRLIDYGRRKYKPPKRLDRFIRAKYQVCAFMTCSRPAVNCDLDHVTAWVDRGETNEWNLIPLCARHHHLKHDAGWSIKHTAMTGTTIWKSPTGRLYTNVAELLPNGESAAAKSTSQCRPAITPATLNRETRAASRTAAPNDEIRFARCAPTERPTQSDDAPPPF